jgi:hypothetical protein
VWGCVGVCGGVWGVWGCGVWGLGGVGVGGCGLCGGVGSLLTFDIPQTALVATLDTYDFIKTEKMIDETTMLYDLFLDPAPMNLLHPRVKTLPIERTTTIVLTTIYN